MEGERERKRERERHLWQQGLEMVQPNAMRASGPDWGPLVQGEEPGAGVKSQCSNPTSAS